MGDATPHKDDPASLLGDKLHFTDFARVHFHAFVRTVCFSCSRDGGESRVQKCDDAPFASFTKQYPPSDPHISRCNRFGPILSLYRTMRRKPSPDELYRRAQTNGYKYGAHHDENSKRVDITYVPKTIRDQNYVLNRYEMYVLHLRKESNLG